MEMAAEPAEAGKSQKEAIVTTVDVYMHRAGNRSESSSLHNGLFGPATTVFHSVLRACQSGLADGEWSPSHATVTVTGGVLRWMLADVHDLERPYHQPADDAQFCAFRDGLVDDADYLIKAIEV
jgi:hypothetical protein